jgi:hypothetical protein
MLTRFDDYPIHQTPEPLAFPASSERNVYGRYWFNGFSKEGEFYFGIAFAVYPNRDVMDCALSIVRADGTQDCFRASRRCPADRSDLRVGRCSSRSSSRCGPCARPSTRTPPASAPI